MQNLRQKMFVFPLTNDSRCVGFHLGQDSYSKSQHYKQCIPRCAHCADLAVEKYPSMPGFSFGEVGVCKYSEEIFLPCGPAHKVDSILRIRYRYKFQLPSARALKCNLSEADVTTNQSDMALDSFITSPVSVLNKLEGCAVKAAPVFTACRLLTHWSF